MRLIFVNHCHPDTPHVCGMRAARFAEACAALGAQVVLLTQTLEDHPPDHAPGALAAALVSHDWARPFLLACAPRRDRILEAFRDGRLPPGPRKAVAAAYYLGRGGVFTDWRDGSRPYWPVLAEIFQPRAVWAVFGNTDALAIGRGIARRAGCPWVMDVKDPWSVFIPAGVRRLTARRFGDPAAVTALSPDHGADAAGWFRPAPRVIHSGIGRDLLVPMPPPPEGARRLLLLGGLYGQAELEALLTGVAQWSRTPDGRGAVLTYAGGEGARLAATAARVAPDLVVETPGYLSLARIRLLAIEARACLYVRAPRALFQHKLFELASLARPMICLPPEGADAGALVASLGGEARGCADAAQVAAALAAGSAHRPPDPAVLAGYGWDAQARALMRVFEEVSA